MSANAAYREVVRNWISGVKDYNLDNLLLLSFGGPLDVLGEGTSGAEVSLECLGSTNELWITRIEVLQLLIDNGFDVLHTDAAAIWIRNPMDWIRAHLNNADALFSQGTVWPYRAVLKYGFFCAGFFVFRSNQITKKLF
ncbi:MAG: hypothetical protein J6386_09565 [Candidatus Synoicihabitans palmerolidicus]|nr:hypothetical protein [Candidatus Synoicihabitans palmerolidicus]